MSDVRLSLLSPVRVLLNGQVLDLGGPRQRAVLAMSRGDLVPAERLIDALWADTPPADPAAALQTFVSRLRRALQPDATARARGQLLVSGASGYALRLEPDQVDAWLFARLEELRIARERRAAARLALGDTAVLVPELEALVREAPLREGRWQPVPARDPRSSRPN
jgi:DNA-binding SARP family transcriptional activator